MTFLQKHKFIELLKKYNFLIILILPLFFLITNILFRNYFVVIHDNEPDFIGNAIHILNFKNQYRTHHPGVPTYYLISLMIFVIAKFNVSFDLLITIVRFTYVSFCIFIILISYLNFHKKNFKDFFVIFIIFSFCSPMYYFASIISPEPLIFSLSFLFFSIILNKQKKYPNYTLALLILALMIAIKTTCIILLPIIIFSYFKKTKKYNFNNLIYYSIIFILFFLIFIFPVIGILPFSYISTAIVIFSKFEFFLSYKIFIILLLSLLISLVLYYKKLKEINLIYLYSVFIIFISLCLILTQVLFSKELNYEKIIIQMRHIIVLLPIIIFFKYKISKIIFYFIFFFTFLSYPSFSKNYFLSESEIDSFINKKNYENIYLYQESVFYSRVHFLHWANNIYANNKASYNFLKNDNLLQNYKKTNLLKIREQKYKKNLRFNLDENKLVRTFLNYRDKKRKEKNNMYYDDGFINNSFFGFNPYFYLNIPFSICDSQLKNIKSGVFIYDKRHSKYFKQDINKVRDIIKNCNFKLSDLKYFKLNTIYFNFNK